MDQDQEPIIRFNVEGSTLHLVQITDLHLAYRYFFKRHHLRRLRRLLRSLAPDVVVNTGDLFCRRRLFSALPLLALYQKYIGRHWPWVFAWGNHDHDLKNHWFYEIESMIASSENAMYVPSNAFFRNYAVLFSDPEDAADTNLGGNYLVEVFSKQGSKHLPVWHLFVFNSRRTEHIPGCVLDWARDKTAQYDYAVPSICFVHKPVMEMRRQAESGTIDWL